MSKLPALITQALIVTGVPTKELFRIAALRANMPDKTFKVAMRLAWEFHSQTKLCEVRAVDIATDIAVSLSTVERAIKWLKEFGWVSGKRGGSTQAVSYTLYIPNAIPVTQMTGMNESPPPVIPVKYGLHTRHHADGTDKTGNWKKGEGVARPPSTATPPDTIDSPPVLLETARNGRSAPVGAPANRFFASYIDRAALLTAGSS